MRAFARRTTAERAAVFEETAARRRIGRAAIVEKDFWVCWSLDHLYGVSGLSPVGGSSDGPALLFKGGTSLSKVYGLIDRFSEDVDLTVDRNLLISASGDPDEPEISGREQKRRIEIVVNQCVSYVRDVVLPFLNSVLGEIGETKATLDDTDLQSIRCQYPRALSGTTYSETAYVTPEIRLEFGARGELWPSEKGSVTPYAAQEFSELFSSPAAEVWALSPKRTFWEKATILHAIASMGRLLGNDRQSRHYADLAQIADSQIGQEAAADFELLRSVAYHKDKYFPSAGARYDLAQPGTLRLIPSSELLTEIETDYERMSEMYFHEPPRFSEILERLTELETVVNR